MNATRHEEYLQCKENLPFSLQVGIQRTATRRSTATNWHDELELQFCTAGEGEVLLDGIRYVFKAGDIVLVNPNAIHYTSTETTIEYTCLIINTSFCKQIGLNCSLFAFQPFIQDKQLCAQLEKLTTLYHQQENTLRTPLLHATLLEILIIIFQTYTTPLRAPTSSTNGFENVKRAIIYLRENYQNKISLNQLARFTMSDKYTLSKRFKAFTGQTIINYLNCYRCKIAQQQIQNGTPVTTAALQCGFENASFFTKTFKKFYGKVPSSCKKTI